MDLEEAINNLHAAGEMDTSNDGALAAAMGDGGSHEEEEEGEGEDEDEEYGSDYEEGEEKKSVKNKTSASTSSSSSSSSSSASSASSSSTTPSSEPDGGNTNPQSFTGIDPLVPGAPDKKREKVVWMFVVGSLYLIILMCLFCVLLCDAEEIQRCCSPRSQCGEWRWSEK